MSEYELIDAIDDASSVLFYFQKENFDYSGGKLTKTTVLECLSNLINYMEKSADE